MKNLNKEEWEGAKMAIKLIYGYLKFQGFSEEEIYSYLSRTKESITKTK